jgi:hypothetical protein
LKSVALLSVTEVLNFVYSQRFYIVSTNEIIKFLFYQTDDRVKRWSQAAIIPRLNELPPETRKFPAADEENTHTTRDAGGG